MAVSTGQLELMLDNDSAISILVKGDMFGQVALQVGVTTHTRRSISPFCMVFVYVMMYQY
jgi:hypothetical protein